MVRVRVALLPVFVLCLSAAAWAGGGVREALRGAIPLSSSDSIESLTRISATRLGVDIYDRDGGKKHHEWVELNLDAMQRVLEAASIEDVPVLVADARSLSAPPAEPPRAVSASASKPRHHNAPSTAEGSARRTSKKNASPEADSAENRLLYIGYQTALSTYVYGLAIPLAFGVDNPRYLIAMPLLTAPAAFGTHLWIARDLEFSESHLKGTTYMATLAVYAATALPLAFSDDYGDGYRIASIAGAMAYPLGVWYGYHLGEVYRSNPDQLDVKLYFALGYAFLGFVTPTLYFEHAEDHSDEVFRIALGQSVGMAVVGHVVADYYHSLSTAPSGVTPGIFTHTLLGALGGIEVAALADASSLRPWIGATVLGSTLGFTEGVLFFQSSQDRFERAQYSLLGGLGGAMMGTGIQLLLNDGSESDYAQKTSWTTAIIGGAWLGYSVVYLLTSGMTGDNGHAGIHKTSTPSSWTFNPLPVLEPALSRGDVEMRWKIPGFSRHF